MHKGRAKRRLLGQSLHCSIIRDIQLCFIVSIVCLSQIPFGTTASAARQQLVQVGLLVKVSTSDEELIINDSDFISTVYSNSTYSVSKQLNACSSKRAPVLVPYQSNASSVAEVVQVRLPNNSVTYNRTSIVMAAIDGVKLHLGLSENIQLRDMLDFVVFCVPTSLSGPAFLASGAYKSFWVVAKASACTNPKILLHEFGHMFGMKHARQDEDEYGDVTSIMGRTTNSENRCFNGYNFWRTGWFNNDYAREILTTSDYQFPIMISLATFVDVSKLQTQQHLVVVLKIDDLYLVYNRRKGCNNETGEFPDMVTVVRALETEESDLVIGLNETNGSNVYRYTNHASQPITIQMCNRHRGNATSADHYAIAIGISSYPCVISPDEKYSSESATATPSRMPITRSPTESLYPTLHVKSENPNLVAYPSIAIPSLGNIDASSTHAPNKREADIDQFSDPPAISPIPTKLTINRAPKSSVHIMNTTLTPTMAPQPRRVPVASNIPAPRVSQSNINFIDYTQSPFPPINRNSQQNKFATPGGNEQSNSHILYIVATASIISLVFTAFVLVLVRVRNANKQMILPIKT